VTAPAPWRRRWFLPESPDVLGLLVRQGEVTLEGIEAFERWAMGDQGQAQRVRELEHAADDARHVLVTTLRRCFTTPLEPEDLFELSERLDGILNRAKDLVREAQVLDMAPDPPMADMTGVVCRAVRTLVGGFGELTRAPDEATKAADAAIHEQRQVERVYRHAMSALLGTGDLREVTGRRELYRRYARIGDAIELTANRVWYAVVKRA
jgi:uncharacterized protein Yka (UPF0111/DUF47 family)